MTKLKYLSPILIVLFFFTSKISTAQEAKSKPTLKQALTEALSNSNSTQEINNTSPKNAKILSKTKTVEKKEIVFSEKDSKKNNAKTSNIKKTTLESRKVKSSLMDALREALKE